MCERGYEVESDAISSYKNKGCGRQEVITKARGEQGSFLYKSTMGFGFPGPHPPAALFLAGKYGDTTAGSTYEQPEAEHLGSSL